MMNFIDGGGAHAGHYPIIVNHRFVTHRHVEAEKVSEDALVDSVARHAATIAHPTVSLVTRYST